MNCMIFLERYLGQVIVIYRNKTKCILASNYTYSAWIYISFELIRFHEWCLFTSVNTTEQCKHKIPQHVKAIVHCILSINECFLQLTSCMLVNPKNVCFQWKPFSFLDTWMKINFIRKKPHLSVWWLLELWCN